MNRLLTFLVKKYITFLKFHRNKILNKLFAKVQSLKKKLKITYKNIIKHDNQWRTTGRSITNREIMIVL